MTENVNAVKCMHCGTQTANMSMYSDHGLPLETATFRFVRCLACNKIIVVDTSQHRVIWPLAADQTPEGVPPLVAEAYSDAMLALAAGSKIGALMAMRTMGERLLRDRNVGSFSKLACEGVITQSLYGIIDQNRLWANTFGHESIRTDRIELGQITELFEFVRTVLETIYTHPLAAKRLSKRTKELQQVTSPWRS